MPSHHEKNAKGVTAEALQGPGSPSSVGKIKVSYRASDTEIDTPTSPSSVSKAPSGPGTGSADVEGPNNMPLGSNPGSKAGSDPSAY